MTPTLLEEQDILLMAEQLKDCRREGPVGLDEGLSLILQNFNPADPMEPALKNVKPFTEETLSRMQDAVNRILGT